MLWSGTHWGGIMICRGTAGIPRSCCESWVTMRSTAAAARWSGAGRCRRSPPSPGSNRGRRSRCHRGFATQAGRAIRHVGVEEMRTSGLFCSIHEAKSPKPRSMRLWGRRRRESDHPGQALLEVEKPAAVAELRAIDDPLCHRHADAAVAPRPEFLGGGLDPRVMFPRTCGGPVRSSSRNRR